MDLSLRLAYRIATLEPAPPDPGLADGPVDMAALRGRLGIEARQIRRAPKFVFDNVAEFYASHDRQVWNLYDDIPNWAPPFPSFFAEWVEPADWNIGTGTGTVSTGRLGQAGFHVVAMEVTDETRDQVGHWAALLAGLTGFRPNPSADVSTLGQALERARWILFCSPWLTCNKPPLAGRPFWCGYYCFLVVDSSGKALAYWAAGPWIGNYLGKGAEPIWSPMHILGLGVSFCHCKNVERVQAPHDRGPRWHARTRSPVFRFYTLNITPMRQVLRVEGNSDQVGIARALHICRGHFATYTPEHPLFGKYAGTFWRPDHVRGRAEAGVVAKDYAVASTKGNP